MNGRAVVWSFAAALCAASPAHAGNPPTFSRMIIEGRYDDWASVPVAFVDARGDNGDSLADFGRVWIANDDEFVYLRFEVGTPTNLQGISAPLRIYFDVDQSAETGWPVGGIGSDFALLFPEKHGAEQSATQFEAAVLTHGEMELVTGPATAGPEFELRVRRDTVLPVRGVPVFGGPGFDVLLEGQTGTGSVGDRAPDGPAGYAYTLATGSLPPYAPIPLGRKHVRYVRLMSHNMLWDGLIKRPAQHTRILQAVRPDIICYQEVNSPGGTVQGLLNSMLPLDQDADWNVYKTGSNVIASRWPLSMQSGDAIPATGRGQAMALVDLPDLHFEVDFYVVSAHFKCCGLLGGAEDQRRQRQADATVNWFRDLREPGGNVDLPPGTPFLICGDFNLVGGVQPLITLLTGDIIDENQYGSDSMPDWDATELGDARPLHNAGPAAYTWRSDSSSFGPGRLDFVIYTDSAFAIAHSYVLNTLDMSDTNLAFYGLQRQDTATASDHLPSVVDFDSCGPSLPADLDRNGRVDLKDFATFANCFRLTQPLPGQCGPRDLTCSDLDGDGMVDLEDFATLAVHYGLQAGP